MTQREIKFRAWDGSRMYHFDNHEWTLDYNDISGWNVIKNVPLEQLKGRKWDAGESSETAEHFRLMQFTGLKDKNGVEIYDGDIVECDGYKMVVRWNERFACFCLMHEKWMYPHFFGEAADNDECEVIGNVFKNPELLPQPPQEQV